MVTELKKPLIFETTFEKYTASSIIGEGGSARIYKAVDSSGSIWAIKCINTECVTKEKIGRFKNELQFCSRNKHSNIVTVVDNGFLKDKETRVPFYVMHMYSGSLRDLINSGIGTDKALIYFNQILNGVEAAHLQGIIHRDLKPENILYDSGKDNLLIADFGIAHFEEEELYTTVETQPTSRLANFQYAAPEQRQRGTEVDYRADIYALGLMLNEMFTKKVPYGTGYTTISQVSANYGYLDELVTEMLRQSVKERLPSIDKVKQQLIGRKNEFVTRQRLSQLKETVIPVTDVDDPLIADPPRLIDADWDHGVLTLFLHRHVNEKWEWALQNIGSYTSVMGKGPEKFAISGNTARVSAREEEVQGIVDYFKEWLPVANRVYEQRIRRDQNEEEEKQRKALQKQTEEQKARQRVLKNIKI